MRLMLEEVPIGPEETVEASVQQAEVQRDELVVERRAGTAEDGIAQPAAPSSADGEQWAF
jgi:stress response protein YsnF